MNMRSPRLLCAALIATSFIAQARASDAIVFHSQGDLDADFNAMKRPGWLALAHSAQGVELKPVRFKIARAVNQSPDSEVTVTSEIGDILTIDSAKEKSGLIGYFLVDGLKPGKIDALDDAATRFDFVKGYRRTFQFKSHSYVLYERGGYIFATLDGKPFATSESKSLGSMSRHSGTDNNEFSIDWAGDLNNDGLIDLVISFSDDRAGETCLFLSSKVGGDVKLRKTGCQDFSG